MYKNKVFGTYGIWLNQSNGTAAWIQLEGDARWVCIPTISHGLGTSLKAVMQDLVSLPEWGSCAAFENEDDCINNGCDLWNAGASPPCSGTLPTTDFSKIVFFFVGMAIVLAVLNVFSGYDTAYPGAFLYIITFVVIILSAANGFVGPGFFYLTGFMRPEHSIFGGGFSNAVNNWIIPAHFILLSLIYFFTTNKRYQSG